MPDLPAISTDIDEPVRLSAPDLTLSENDLSFSPEAFSPPAPAPQAAAPAPTPPADSGMIEFDLGALSLDLDPPAVAPPLPVVNGDDTAGAPLDTGSSAISTGFDDMGADPLATKLALAEEFSAIGDPDGARSLAEEVMAEASGPLKARAQRFLAELA